MVQLIEAEWHYMLQWIKPPLIQIMAFWRQTIIWIITSILSIGSLGMYFNEILIEIKIFA